MFWAISEMEKRGNLFLTAFNLFEFDKSFNKLIIGTDEAGRGPGAGGVFAGAVYFPSPDDELIKKLSELNDSKKLSKKKREELYEIILKNSINSTVCVEVEEIEKINILNASLKAMKLACENVIKEIMNSKSDKKKQFICHPEFISGSNRHSKSERYRNKFGMIEYLVLVDGNKLIKNFNSTQKTIVKGDSKSASIAAASILAKVSRDRYMAELHEKFPQYNWVQNAGYLTKEHLSAIDKYGITPTHRKKFLRKHTEKCIKQLSLYQK